MRGGNNVEQVDPNGRCCDACSIAGHCRPGEEGTAERALQESQHAGQASGLPPGHGTLYVDANTLPAGPFLAYDHKGRLVSAIYMIPLKDMDGQKAFPDLAAPGGKVDHVSRYYNAGHPRVEEPHYHIVLW
jgi:hypothetical protein